MAGNNSKIVEEAVSESEKLGVAVLGRRFGEKVEDVPIKKRRLMFRTTSPPPQLLSEESEHLVGTQCTSGLRSYPNLIAQQQAITSDSTFAMFGHVVDFVKFQQESDQTTDYSEDFFEILAAATCNNSMGDTFDNAEEGPVVEDFSAKEGVYTSRSAIPLKETIEFLGASKDFSQGEQMDGVSHSTSVAVLHDLHPKLDEGTLKKSVASQDDRSHWNLNTIIDAWEQTCDDHIVNSQKKVLEGNSCDVMYPKKLENSEGCEVQRDLGGTQCGMEGMTQHTVSRVVSGEVDEAVHMLADSRGHGNRNYRSDGDEHKFEASPSSNETCWQGTFITSLAENVLKESILTMAEANVSPQVVSTNRCSRISEGNKNAEPGIGTINHGNGDYVSGSQLGLALCSKSVQVENNNVALPPASVSEEPACETCVFDNRDNKLSPRKMCTSTCQSLGAEALPFENLSSKSDKEDVSYSSIDCVDLSASNVYLGEGQHTISVDAKGQDYKASIDDVTTGDPPVRIEPEELVNKFRGGITSHEATKIYGDDSASRSSKIDLEYPLDDSYDSDVSQDKYDHIVGMESETKLHEGCDSHYAEGELKQSDVYCWQGNENEDGEAEHVDYESDNGGTYNFDTADNSVSVSGKVEAGSECEKQRFFGSDHFDCEGDKIYMGEEIRDITCQRYLGGSLATDVTEDELSKRGSVNASSRQWRKQFIEKNGSEKIEINIMVENGLRGESDDVIQKIKHSAGGKALMESMQSVSPKMKLSERLQFPDDCGVSPIDKDAEIDYEKFVVPRAKGKELLSCTEAPSSSDGLDRKDTRLMQRCRYTNLNDSYPHFERVTDSDKLMRRGRSSLHMHDRSQRGGSWVDHSEHDWDSKHHHSSSYYAPYDSEHPGPKSVNVNSKGAYHRVIRSPADRDAAYGKHTGMAPMRDISTHTRGRSGRYAQGFGRGIRIPRNEYHEPGLDDTESSVRGPYYLARGRTFSSNYSKGAPRSRSRSSSPLMWLLGKERNVGLRHFSGSPDFRSEARIDMSRFPFQKPSFTADFDEGFMPPPKNRFYPQQNSRMIDNRDCAVDHMGDRRSPVRMVRQRKFDSVGVPGRLKSDSHFRPMINTGRFSEIDAAGRGRSYENDNGYRRKFGDRFDTHPGRQYDNGGFVRQIRYDAENGFVAHSSHDKDDCVRSTDRRQRNVPWKVREEKDQQRNNRFRMVFPCNESGPKTFGLQEYDEDASPGRGRPFIS